MCGGTIFNIIRAIKQDLPLTSICVDGGVETPDAKLNFCVAQFVLRRPKDLTARLLCELFHAIFSQTSAPCCIVPRQPM